MWEKMVPGLGIKIDKCPWNEYTEMQYARSIFLGKNAMEWIALFFVRLKRTK